jgi:hypothetical protein
LQAGTKKETRRAAISQITAKRAIEYLRGSKWLGPQRGITSSVYPKGYIPQIRPGVPVPTKSSKPVEVKPSSSNQAKTNTPKPPKPKTTTGQDWAARVAEGKNKLTRTLSQLGGINARDARLLADFYQTSTRKGGSGVAKYDPVTGAFTVKHGAFLDKANIKNVLSAAKSWDASGRKATRNPTTPKPKRKSSAKKR